MPTSRGDRTDHSWLEGSKLFSKPYHRKIKLFWWIQKEGFLSIKKSSFQSQWKALIGSSTHIPFFSNLSAASYCVLKRMHLWDYKGYTISHRKQPKNLTSVSWEETLVLRTSSRKKTNTDAAELNYWQIHGVLTPHIYPISVQYKVVCERKWSAPKP